MAPPQPRSVIAAREEGGRFVLTLDGGQEVETEDGDTADAAWQSKKDGQQVTVELEAPQGGGRSRLLELTVLPKGGAAPSTAVATRPASTSNAIARPNALPTGLIMDPEALSEQLRAMQASYNVLSPAIAISNMAPGFGANLAVVQIDASIVMDTYGNGSGPDTYFSKSIHKEASKRSLNKSGLQKISQALGIQWDHNACQRLDDGRERNFWLWKYVGYVRTHDGQMQTVEGSRELDLRPGSAEALEMKDAQLQKARASGNQICETKAMQRAIRTYVRQVYTVDELKKPFLIVRFSFTPDMDDPAIKALVTQHAMSGLAALYPAPAGTVLPALPPAPDDIDEALATVSGEAKPEKEVGHAHTPRANRFTEDTAAAKAEEIPLGQTTIEKVEKRDGSNKQGPWVLYVVTLGTGEVASTFSKTMQETIDEAVKQKAFVKYTTTENPGYDDKLATLELVDKRQQTLPMGKEAKY